MSEPDARRSPMLVPLIVATALFMENLDSTIIATALPDMAATFGTSPVRLNIAITGYLLALAICIPISGWVADRFGASTVFRCAIATFTIASILCGISNSLPELTAARILQGAAGAMMVPVARLVLLRSVPKSELVRSMAWFTVPALIGPVFGPPLGGFITTYASWRYIFFINIPIGMLGIVLVTIFIKEDRKSAPHPLDWVGFLLTGAALGLFIWGLDSFTRDHADIRLVAGFLLAGVAFGVAAVMHARRHPHPLLDLSLFRIRTFATNCEAGTIYRFASSAVPFLMPLLLQVGFGMSAFASGMLTLAQALGAMPMKVLARSLLRNFGFRTVLILDGLLTATIMASCTLLTADTPRLAIMLVIFLFGLFRSLQFTSLQSMGYADIPPERMSSSTSLALMFQQVANALGVAVAAILLQISLAWRGADALAAIDFRFAFLTIATVAATATLLYLRLPADAAAEVSGHRPKPVAAPAQGD